MLVKEWIAEKRCKVGVTFIFDGKLWKVVSVKQEEKSFMAKSSVVLFGRVIWLPGTKFFGPSTTIDPS